jgi:hypothetical protein
MSGGAGLWRGLAANLRGGTRLSFFLPVRASDFRVSAGQYAMVVGASFVAWLIGGMLRGGFPGTLSGAAFVSGLGQLPLVLLVCLLAATLLGDSLLLLPLAILITATDPAFEAVSVLVAWLAGFEETAPYATGLNWLFILWGIAVVLRAQHVAAGWRGARSIGAWALFVALLAFFVLFFPRQELWAAFADEAQPQGAYVLSEEAFHTQERLLDVQLEALEPERPGIEDLYFVGAAPDGSQETFIKELGAVRQLMNERFDTAGRSLALSNHPATLAGLPLATSTNLAEALGGLGDMINPEEDVVFLFLTSHGYKDHQLSFEAPGLALTQVNPTVLARMLADSGIKWRVIVISACYAGGFIEPLKDDNSLIITAADATHTSFGCEATSDYTWFSRAYFHEGLRQSRSFTEAFERARQIVAEREKQSGFEPSNPQMHLGNAMKDKLDRLQRRLESRNPGAAAVQAMR